MTSYLTRMPQGVPGDISRQAMAKVEPQLKNSALPFGSFGIPGKIVSGKFVPCSTAADGVKVYGFLVRPFPTQGANASDPLGTAVPAVDNMPADVMRSGYMTVKNNSGTPAMAGAVYVRIANASGPKPIGGVEAALVTNETELIPGAIFMSAADGSGNVEISYNI